MIREWISSLIKILLNPKTGLFERCDTHQMNYKIKEDSTSVHKWEDLYNFMGQIIGKALFDRIPVSLCFSKVLFKAILDEKPCLSDIQYLDESVKSIVFIGRYTDLLSLSRKMI